MIIMHNIDIDAITLQRDEVSNVKLIDRTELYNHLVNHDESFVQTDTTILNNIYQNLTSRINK